MSTAQFRKCAKCRKTSVENNLVPYHRFPNPGTTNILRATAWATYCWPECDWSSVHSLTLLHKKGIVLCGNHFQDSCYTDHTKKRLSKYAIPGTIEYIIKLLHTLRSKISSAAIVQQVDLPHEPIAGCSGDPVTLVEQPSGSLVELSKLKVDLPVAGCSGDALNGSAVWKCSRIAQADGVMLHCFPSPLNVGKPKELERFRTWVMRIGGDIVGKDNCYIYRYKRVCHRHFEDIYIYPSQHLNRLAIPTLHLPDALDLIRAASIDHGYTRKLHTDHNYHKLEEDEQKWLEDDKKWLEELPFPFAGKGINDLQKPCDVHLDHSYGLLTTSMERHIVPIRIRAPSPKPDTKRTVTTTSDGTQIITPDGALHKTEPCEDVKEAPTFDEDDFAGTSQELETTEVEDPEQIEAAPTTAAEIFSWQKDELIEADEVEEPPPPAEPTLALECEPGPAPGSTDHAVPELPAPIDVDGRCNDCGEVNDGFEFWCVQCVGGALCGACGARPPHHAHYVLRAPVACSRARTQEVLALIRQHLQDGNLLTLEDDGVKVEVKEEPPDAPPEPEPCEPDPLACGEGMLGDALLGDALLGEGLLGEPLPVEPAEPAEPPPRASSALSQSTARTDTESDEYDTDDTTPRPPPKRRRLSDSSRENFSIVCQLGNQVIQQAPLEESQAEDSQAEDSQAEDSLVEESLVEESLVEESLVEESQVVPDSPTEETASITQESITPQKETLAQHKPENKQTLIVGRTPQKTPVIQLSHLSETQVAILGQEGFEVVKHTPTAVPIKEQASLPRPQMKGTIAQHKANPEKQPLVKGHQQKTPVIKLSHLSETQVAILGQEGFEVVKHTPSAVPNMEQAPLLRPQLKGTIAQPKANPENKRPIFLGSTQKKTPVIQVGHLSESQVAKLGQGGFDVVKLTPKGSQMLSATRVSQIPHSLKGSQVAPRRVLSAPVRAPTGSQLPQRNLLVGAAQKPHQLIVSKVQSKPDNSAMSSNQSKGYQLTKQSHLKGSQLTRQILLKGPETTQTYPKGLQIIENIRLLIEPQASKEIPKPVAPETVIDLDDIAEEVEYSTGETVAGETVSGENVEAAGEIEELTGDVDSVGEIEELTGGVDSAGETVEYLEEELLETDMESVDDDVIDKDYTIEELEDDSDEPTEDSEDQIGYRIAGMTSRREASRRKVEAEKSPVRGRAESMVRTLPSEAVVEVRPLTSLEIKKWLEESKRFRKD